MLVTPEYHGLFLFGGKKAWRRNNKRGGGWDGHKWICLFAWIVTKLVDVEMELTNKLMMFVVVKAKKSVDANHWAGRVGEKKQERAPPPN